MAVSEMIPLWLSMLDASVCNNYSIWQVNVVIQPVMLSGWRKQGAYCNRRGVNAYVIMVVYV